jgi:hypothetical protein
VAKFGCFDPIEKCSIDKMKSGEPNVLIRKLELLNQLHSKNLIRVEVLVKRQDIIVGELLETVEEAEDVIASNYIYDAFISYRR